jgi:hypothetical protein
MGRCQADDSIATLGEQDGATIIPREAGKAGGNVRRWCRVPELRQQPRDRFGVAGGRPADVKFGDRCWSSHVRFHASSVKNARRYTTAMRSIADDLRRESLAADAERTPWDRIRAALALGDADVRLFASVHTLSLDEARRHLERQRQHGRTPSACHAGRFE